MKIFTKVIFVLLLLASPVFAQWTQNFDKSGKTFLSLSSPNIILTGGNNGIVFKTTNDGNNWTLADSLRASIYCIVVNDIGLPAQFQNLYAGTYKGLFKSTNRGSNWTKIGFDNIPIYAVKVFTGYGTDSIIIVGTGNGVHRSTNGGVNWELPQLGGIVINYINQNTTSGLFIGTSNGVYLSPNKGGTWTHYTETAGKNIHCIEWLGGTLYIAGFTQGTSEGYLYSTSSTTITWFQANQYAIYSIGSVNSNGFLMGDRMGRVFRYRTNPFSISSGVLKNAGLPSLPVTAIIRPYWSNYAFTGFDNGNDGIYRCVVSYVGVKKIASEVPSKFELKQNYPNPFNPTTVIKYQVPKENIITLKVFDITGKEIETLVNESQSPGTYEVNWDASKYSSGTYFYKIQTEGYIDTKRMLLVK